jgi:hypothetical protein
MRRNTLSAIALAVLILGGGVCARAEAAAPPVQPLNDPGPLFNPHQFQVNPVDFAMQAFAASALPTRAHGTAAVLIAGESKSVRAWNLEGPLTGQEGRTLTGAATLILNSFGRNPILSTLAVLKAGDWLDCWTLRDPDRFHPIPEDWLQNAKDGRPIVEGDVECWDYARILALARNTSNKAMRANSRRDVTTSHLMTEPAFHRGRVIFFEGHVYLVNRYEPPPPPPDGVTERVSDLYEAWIFPDTMGAQAVCVVFTEWPAGLPRSLLGKGRLKEGVRVQVAGYFFKLYGYDTKDRTQPLKKAPLLVAHTITPAGKPPAPFAETTAWVKPIIYLIPSMLVALIFLVVGLTYYYRRQDQLLRDRLRLARNAEFVPPPPDAVPVAAPVATAVPMAQPATRGYTLRPPAPGRHGRQGDGPSSDEGSSESGGKPPDDPTGA